MAASKHRSTIRNLLLEAPPAEMMVAPESDIDLMLHICRVGYKKEIPTDPRNIHRACQAIAKRHQLQPVMQALMMRKWGTDSLNEMSPPALKDLFYYMRGLERLKKQPMQEYA